MDDRRTPLARARGLGSAKDHPCGDFPGKTADGKYNPAVVLDLDYWLLMPRR